MSTKRLHSALFVILWLLISAIRTDAQTIGGTPQVCTGYTTSLIGSPTGGTWSSSSAAIATVGTSGVVTGVSSGVAVITYDIGTGFTTVSVTVNPVPASIAGTASVCSGSGSTLSDTTPGGTWSSSNTSIVTIGSSTGALSGLSAGTATISYVLSSTGCLSTTTVTVNPAPGAISGTAMVCVGSNTSLSNSIPGGIWISSSSTIASISSGGVVTGNAAGNAMITYSLPTSCMTTRMVTVNPTPTISGSTAFCNGTSASLSGTLIGGTWTSSDPTIATFSTPSSGVLNSVSPGNITVTYTLPTGCFAARPDTVLLAPGPVTGPSSICVGSSSTLGNSVGGGIWASSAPSIATIGATTGIITGITFGAATISYTLSNGCSKTASETVNPLPASITGTLSVCIGANTTLASGTPGGTWSSSSTIYATVSPTTGIVTGATAGTATITYRVSTGCFTTSVVTINGTPSAGSISTVATLCPGATTTVSSTVSGGTWISDTPSVATIGLTSAIVTAMASGTTKLTYSVSNTCGTAIATKTVTVSATPTISGVSPACIGLTSTLSSSSGCGTWSSSSPSVATVTALTTTTGLVTGIAGGTATISFTSCAGCIATKVVTIVAAPPSITGASTVCMGATMVLDDIISGGIWSSSNPSVASVSVIGAFPGSVTGVSTGTTTITYELTSSCITTTTITVNPLPIITASVSTATCGRDYIAVASGGSTYSWVPTTGVSCSTCGTTTIAPTDAGIYTVTGTNSSGCSNTATVSIDANRIYGHISFSGATPSAMDMKVWLIQFNAADSTIIAVDSTLSCVDSGSVFYQFSSKPAGNYLVKAKLLSSVPGTSDYIPTYGYSSAHWNLATPIVHTSAGDSQHIRMMYGTVLTGPGVISGYVSAGAGKGTASAAAAKGMLVFLKNVVTGVILNYTYTDASGKYSFANLPYGNYVVYPEEYGYYTTPSPILTVGPSVDSTGVSFKKHTDNGTITPNNDLSWLSIATVSQNSFQLYPNPSTGVLNIELPQPYAFAKVTVSDATGRTVYQQDISNNNGDRISLQLQGLQSGLYILSINTGDNKLTSKFTIQ